MVHIAIGDATTGNRNLTEFDLGTNYASVVYDFVPAGGKPARAAVAALLFLALAAVGLEAFLRRTLPEHSLQAALLQWLGSVEPISYSSGNRSA